MKWELENAPGEPAQAMGGSDDQMGCTWGPLDDHHMNNMSLEYEGIRLTLRHEHRLFLCMGMEQYVDQRAVRLLLCSRTGHLKSSRCR